MAFLTVVLEFLCQSLSQYFVVHLLKNDIHNKTESLIPDFEDTTTYISVE